jgi:predicted membrane-bound spermidine synthase
VPPDKTPRERAEDLIRLLVPWRPTTRQGLWAIRIGIVLGLLVAIGYSYGVTLWDWIKLLIVPAVIAGGGLWFNRQQRERELEIAREQREREQRIANERAQDEALQGYLDGMSQLLTDKERPLHKAQTSDSLSTVARARTLTVLGRLDGGRKRSVLQFLFESGLID